MFPRVPTLRISSVAVGPQAEPGTCEGNSRGDGPQCEASYGTYCSSAFELVSINSTIFFITGVRGVSRAEDTAWGRAVSIDLVLWDLPCGSTEMPVELSVVQTPPFLDHR